MFIEVVASKHSVKQRKMVQGVGINDAEYKVSNSSELSDAICPYYIKWRGMLERCYCPLYHSRYPTYVGCTVCKEWLTFSNFSRWMKAQDWVGMQLDKDILIPGNKEYSPNTCVFVTQEVNKLLRVHQANTGLYPRGTYKCPQTGRYTAYCNVRGAKKKLGTYATLEKAVKVYVSTKTKEIIRIANIQKDVRVKKALYAITKDKVL